MMLAANTLRSRHHFFAVYENRELDIKNDNNVLVGGIQKCL